MTGQSIAKRLARRSSGMTPRRTRIRHTSGSSSGGLPGGVRRPMHSTWWVIGNASYARSGSAAIRPHGMSRRPGQMPPGRRPRTRSREARHATSMPYDRAARPRSAADRAPRRPARPRRRIRSTVDDTTVTCGSRPGSTDAARTDRSSDSTRVTEPRGPTASASAAAKSPAPPYRSQARSPGRGASRSTRPPTNGRGGGRMHLPERGRIEPALAAGRDLGRPRPARRPDWHGRRRPSAVTDTSPALDATTSTASSSGQSPAGHRQLPASPGAAIRQVSTGTTSCERCLSSPARPPPSPCTAAGYASRAVRRRSGQPFDGTAQRVDLVRGQPTEPGQLLAHDGRLQFALGRRLDVLEVAAAAAIRSGVRARRRDPVRRTRSQDLDGVGPQVTLALLGDLGEHPLAGQGVADEHHRRRPGHAVPPWAPGRREARPVPLVRTRTDRPGRSVVPSNDGAVGHGAVGSLSVLGCFGFECSAASAPGRPRGPRSGLVPRDRPRVPRRLEVLADRGLQLPRHAGHHDAGLVEQPALEPQRALVVQQVLQPLADDVLRDEHRDHVARRVSP